MSLYYKILPERRRKKLKNLLQEKPLLRFLEAHNGLSALIVNTVKLELEDKALEFDGIWESSFTNSASKGLPDAEIVSFDSRIHNIFEILNVTDKPLIVDGDTGGDIISFQYLVSKLEKIGISAIIIEDKQFPKRNSLEEGVKQTQEDPFKFAYKISKGKEILQTEDFMIIARIESLINGKDIEDAIKRAEIYLEAGADGIMIHSKEKRADKIFEFAEKYNILCKKLSYRKPLVCVPTTYNTVFEEELEKYGFNIVIYANHLLRSAYKYMYKTALEILINKRCFEAEKYCASLREIFDIVGFSNIKKIEKEQYHVPEILILGAGKIPDSLNILGEIPSPLIPMGKKSLFEIQREILKEIGVNNIKLVVGYKAELIENITKKFDDVILIYNEKWHIEGILSSFLTGLNKIKGSFIYIEGDILFSKSIMKQFFNVINQNPNYDFILMGDPSFKFHPEGKSEDLIMASLPYYRSLKKIIPQVVRIGTKVPYDEAHFEFTGIAYISKKGTEVLREISNKFFSENLQKADFVDLIQQIVYEGYEVYIFEVNKGWIEIDCKENYELAKEQLND